MSTSEMENTVQCATRFNEFNETIKTSFRILNDEYAKIMIIIIIIGHFNHGKWHLNAFQMLRFPVFSFSAKSHTHRTVM